MTSISVQCPQCQQRYNAPAALAGRNVKCKHCGRAFPIPSPASEEDRSLQTSAGPGAEGGPSPIPNVFSEAGTMPAAEPAPGKTTSGGGQLGHAGAGHAARMARRQDTEELALAETAAPIVMLRPTILFDFPGARFIDRWLPIVLLAGGISLLVWMAAGTNLSGVEWVTTARIVAYLSLCLVVVSPAGYAAVSMAARKCRLRMPPLSLLRALGAVVPAFAIAFAFWLSGQSLSMLVVGAVMGLVLASGAIWFLFRVQTRELGTILGASGAAFLASVAVSYLILLGLNVIFIHSARSSGDNQLTVSPMGPTFAWDVPVAAPAKPKHHAMAAAPPDAPPAAPPPTAAAPQQQRNSTATPSTPATTDPTAKVVPSHPTDPPADPHPAVQGESPGGRKIDPHETKPATTKSTKPALKPVPTALPREVAAIRAVVDLGEFPRVIFPTGGGKIVVAAKKDPTRETFAFYQGDPLRPGGQTSFEIETEVNPKCCLSPNGETLARLTLFPKLSVILWDTLGNKEHKVVALNPDHGKPELLGFGFNDTLVVLWDNGGFTDVEVINTKGTTPATVAAMRMRPFDRSLCNPAISADGRQLAAATFVDKKGGIDLWDLTTSRKGEVRTCFVPLGTWVTPAAITYAPTAGRLAAFFDLGGKGVIYSFRAGDGAMSHEFAYRELPFPAAATEGFTGRMLDYMDGNDWLLAGRVVIDSETGKILTTLPVENVKAQRIVDKQTALLFTRTPDGKNQLIEVKFNLDELAARRAEARTNKVPPR